MSEAVAEPAETVGLGEAPADSEVEQEAAQDTGEDFFWQKVKADPEYAIEQIKKRDGRVTEQANRLKEMEQIEHMVRLAGGSDQLMSYAQVGARINQIPGLADLVQSSLQTGQLALPQQEASNGQEEEQYMDPEIREAVSPLAEKISRLEQTIEQLQGVANAASVRSMEDRVKENINAALSEFERDPEAFQEASETIARQYKAALEAAERGDETQARLIEQLAGPQGQDLLDTVLMKVYKKHAAKLVGGASTQSKPGEMETLGRATDERPQNVVRPGPPGLPPRPKGRPDMDFVLKTLRAAGAAKGIDTRTL